MDYGTPTYRPQPADDPPPCLYKSEALRYYAKQSKDIDMANWAAEIRIRAERRMGEMLKDQELNKAGGQSKKPTSRTMQPLGIQHFQMLGLQNQWKKTTNL